MKPRKRKALGLTGTMDMALQTLQKLGECSIHQFGVHYWVMYVTYHSGIYTNPSPHVLYNTAERILKKMVDKNLACCRLGLWSLTAEGQRILDEN